MKTIQLSDEDYELLMQLSKELQTQENDGQAKPIFWEAMSLKSEPNCNGEGEIVKVYDDGVCDLESYASSDGFENYNKFLKTVNENDTINYYTANQYHKALEQQWIDYIEYNFEEARIVTSDWKDCRDHNPSLFKSDVIDYIETNMHHSGGKPHTFADTVWRMPKMIKLVDILSKLNNEPEQPNE